MPIPATLAVDDRRRLVAAIHHSPTMMVLAVAGGGNAVMIDLLEVGGASRTVLEMVVPYAQSAMVELVGPMPKDRSLVSAEHAEAMADAALVRARGLAPDAMPVIGVAITAALASDRPKRGPHRAHLAVAGDDRTIDGRKIDGRRIDLTKGELDRAGEDRVVADAALAMIAAACGLD